MGFSLHKDRLAQPLSTGTACAVPGSLVLLVWRWVLLAWLMWGIGEACTVAQVGGLAIPTYAGCRRARGRQGAAWKRRRCLTRRVPAGLDAPCARRLQDLAVGMEECSRRRSNQRMDLEENEEAGLRSRRDCACVRFARVRFVGSLNVGHPMSWWNSLDPTCPHICASQRIMPAHSLASLNPAQVGSFSQASRQALRVPTLIGTIGAYDCCRPFLPPPVSLGSRYSTSRVCSLPVGHPRFPRDLVLFGLGRTAPCS